MTIAVISARSPTLDRRVPTPPGQFSALSALRTVSCSQRAYNKLDACNAPSGARAATLAASRRCFVSATCDGCLGLLTCWVCLGTGAVENRHAQAVACMRCFGTGKCAKCQTIAVIDLDRAERKVPSA
jgi:hypothetical protein